MSYFPGKEYALIERVSDRTANNTTVGQTAEMVGFAFNRNQVTRECSLDINLVVTPYSIKEDGSLGDQLTGKLFNRYTIPMNGANDTLVNKATGEVLLIQRQVGLVGRQWQQAIDNVSIEVDTQLQGDWLEETAATKDIVIFPLIRKFIKDADAKGFFLQ